MIRVQLSQGKEALIDDIYGPFVNQWKWMASEKSKGKYYAVRGKWLGTINGKKKYKSILMHREIVKKIRKADFVDHKNGDTLDCTRSNLRVCTSRQNCINSVRKRGTSKYKNVYLCKRTGNTWIARIRINGKKTYLGTYQDEIEAAKVADEAMRKHHGVFACTNFPQGTERQA